MIRQIQVPAPAFDEKAWHEEHDRKKAGILENKSKPRPAGQKTSREDRKKDKKNRKKYAHNPILKLPDMPPNPFDISTCPFHWEPLRKLLEAQVEAGKLYVIFYSVNY